MEKLSTNFVSVLTLSAGAAGSGVFSLAANDPRLKFSVKRIVLASGLFWVTGIYQVNLFKTRGIDIFVRNK